MVTKHKLKLGHHTILPIQIQEKSTEVDTDLSLTLYTGSLNNPSEISTLDSEDISFTDNFNLNSMDVDNDNVGYDYLEGDDIDGDDVGGVDDDSYDDDDDDGYDLSIDAEFDAKDLPPGVEATLPWLRLGSSSSTFPGQPCSYKELEQKDQEILKKFREFKHFETVADFSDHYFIDPKRTKEVKVPSDSSKVCTKGVSLVKQTHKDWSKQIQREWKILEENLPESIYVRAYEERMDLMRAVIVGPAGTPYHDGLFFFDIHFPSEYPFMPPNLYYHSGGLRLNPNLYSCGKVCLSLLNTWYGADNERWTPGESTVLQVLVSIQGLVLNPNPYFNEPGYEKSAGKPEGEMKSRAYNESTFLLSCKTMLYILRRQPKHFEDFVVGHYYERAHAILEACKAYIDGARVGLPSGPKLEEEPKDSKRNQKSFKQLLEQMFPTLLVAFTDNGADCRLFLPQKDDSKDKAVN